MIAVIKIEAGDLITKAIHRSDWNFVIGLIAREHVKALGAYFDATMTLGNNSNSHSLVCCNVYRNRYVDDNVVVG